MTLLTADKKAPSGAFYYFAAGLALGFFGAFGFALIAAAGLAVFGFAAFAFLATGAASTAGAVSATTGAGTSTLYGAASTSAGLLPPKKLLMNLIMGKSPVEYL